MKLSLPSHRVNFYKALHQKARKRLALERARHQEQRKFLEERYRQKCEKQCEQLAKRLKSEYDSKLSKFKGDYAAKAKAYEAKILELKQTLSLYTDKAKGINQKDKIDTTEAGSRKRDKSRPKGGKPKGTKGGRQSHSELPVEDIILPLNEEERKCPCCGLLAESTGLERCSEQVGYEVKLVRKRTRRPVYQPGCQCKELPQLFQAPLPPRAFSRSLYSDDFWIEVLLSKYAYQIPSNVLIRQFTEYGLKGINPSTITGGIKRAAEFFEPLYDAIKAKNKLANRWKSDESSLALFIAREGRETFNYCLWQYQCSDTVVFVFCPTRAGEHPREYFKGCKGILNVDRAKAYQTLPELIVLAFCWAHVRRDFIKIGRYQKGHRTWALTYTQMIKRIFRQNRKRLKAVTEDEFKVQQLQLEQNIDALRKHYEAELNNENLPEVRRKPLKSLKNHWKGLTVFVDNPEVPMDNNEAERSFRDVARFRQNCNGVFSEKFGEITAMMLTIFATLRKSGISLSRYLKFYLEYVAANHGDPPQNLTGLCPWDLPESTQKRLLKSTDVSPKPFNTS
ncbi:MAG: IS66 family transposase [bacterium]|nr:IS66 family transposase [bacterium]